MLKSPVPERLRTERIQGTMHGFPWEEEIEYIPQVNMVKVGAGGIRSELEENGTGNNDWNWGTFHGKVET